MNKSDKIIIFFYIFLALSYGIYILTTSEGLEENLIELILPKKITEFETSVLIDVEKERIFDVITNVKNYPVILPKNIVDINILNKTNNVIIAEEELSEAGIKTKLIAKHTIIPYSKHTIEILEGDAKGTVITQSFESVNSQTKLTTNVNLNLKGVVSVVAFLPESSLIHAVNTVISHFVEYSNYDVYETLVDSLYQKILHRTADSEGLLHYSSLLRNEQITEQDLRIILLNSEERSLMEMKTIDQLNTQTINVVNDLYEKILLRKADPEGMRYFGYLLETGTSSDEIRTMLLESDEGKDISSFHPIRSEINKNYRAILDRSPEDSELNYYHKMIDDGLMTLEDVKKELEEYKEYNNLEK